MRGMGSRLKLLSDACNVLTFFISNRKSNPNLIGPGLNGPRDRCTYYDTFPDSVVANAKKNQLNEMIYSQYVNKICFSLLWYSQQE